MQDKHGVSFCGVDCFRVWTCDGCEEPLFQQACGVLKCNPRKGKPWYTDQGEHEIALYPDRTEGSVPVRHYVKLPKPIATAYYETVFAHHHSLYLLCALGLRSIIEALCKDQGISGRDLRQKIDGLTKLLPPITAKRLHSLRFIGNRAAHEFRESRQETLRLGIEVCEDILNFLYELDHRASRLERDLAQEE